MTTTRVLTQHDEHQFQQLLCEVLVRFYPASIEAQYGLHLSAPLTLVNPETLPEHVLTQLWWPRPLHKLLREADTM